METIRVLVVDDHPVVRQGLRSLLANHADIQVVGEAENAAGVFAGADLKPDVILLDIRMPGLNGIEITQRLKRERPQVKVLILSTYDDDELLFGALRAGAEGYLLKSSSPEMLASAIRQVAHGQRLLTDSLVGRLMSEFQGLAQEKAHAAAGLSDLELQVLHMIADGATNKEIAEKTYWSEVTVKRKVQDVLEKLGASNRAQAVAEAARRGLL